MYQCLFFGGGGLLFFSFLSSAIFSSFYIFFSSLEFFLLRVWNNALTSLLTSELFISIFFKCRIFEKEKICSAVLVQIKSFFSVVGRKCLSFSEKQKKTKPISLKLVCQKKKSKLSMSRPINTNNQSTQTDIRMHGLNW